MALAGADRRSIAGTRYGWWSMVDRPVIDEAFRIVFPSAPLWRAGGAIR
jgi:hypothetical protein